MKNEKNYLYGNATNADLRGFDEEIACSLRATGALPEELADLFKLAVLQNPDGSPRYIISWADDR
jgi:hypothetical protein